MIALLVGWPLVAVVVAVVLGAVIAYRDRQVPTDAGCPCGCALCVDCETEDVR